jgi:hypothetical protein
VLNAPTDHLRWRGHNDDAAPQAEGWTGKQTGRWTKKPPAEGDQKFVKGPEIFDSATSEIYSHSAEGIEKPTAAK